MLGNVDVQGSPPVMTDYEEAVEHAEGDRWDGEKVHRGDGFAMIAEKGEPTLGWLRIPGRSFYPTGDRSFQPSMSSSPWMRGAPQVGFSATIRKINSRISLQVCLRPSGFLTLEISLQSKRKPTRCHRTTVSGVTMMRDSFHPDQNRRTATQKILSKRRSLRRGCRRFSTASCWRKARFSRRRLRRAPKSRSSVPRQSLGNRNMARSYNRTPPRERLCD